MKNILLFQVHLYIIIVWVMAIFFGVCPLLGWNKYTAEVFPLLFACYQAADLIKCILFSHHIHIT